MLAVYCDQLDKRVLLDLRSLTTIEGESGRLSVSYRCACGRRGTMLTGRDRAGRVMSGHIVD